MDEPVSKKVKRDFCKKVLVTGKRCSFPHQLSSEFCKRHTQNIDSFTNTEGTMLDITTAHETILCMLDELTRKDRYIDDLQYKYDQLKEKVIDNFIEKN